MWGVVVTVYDDSVEKLSSLGGVVDEEGWERRAYHTE